MPYIPLPWSRISDCSCRRCTVDALSSASQTYLRRSSRFIISSTSAVRSTVTFEKSRLLVLDDFSAKFRRRKGAQALGHGWEGRV